MFSIWLLKSLWKDNVEWFLNEVIKIENERNFYFKNTKQILQRHKKLRTTLGIVCFVGFAGFPFEGRGVTDHCHITGKYRGAAHEKCNINVKQKQSVSYHSHFTTSVIMISICSLKQ